MVDTSNHLRMRLRPTILTSHPDNSRPNRFPTGAAALIAKSWLLESR